MLHPLTQPGYFKMTSISFEFFPPKTDKGRENLHTARQALEAFNPEFFSVTFGAGGSTRNNTCETIFEIQEQSSIPAAPHLSCIGSTRENITQLLDIYLQAGVKRIVTLRGDLPPGSTDTGEFRYANELVSFIRETTGDAFHLEVAAYPEMHPESNSADADMTFFKQKIDAGADSAITQYFFNIDAYFDFCERATTQNISAPVVPGIMPITNYEQLARFSSTCGAEIPLWLHNRLQGFGDDLDAIRAFGLDFVTELCDRLLTQGAPGLHFYTLNQSHASLEILTRLNRTG